jgi:hypothetical protein
MQVNWRMTLLIFMYQTSDILYYEVLDIPLPELQALKTLKVTYHHATKDEVILLDSLVRAVDRCMFTSPKAYFIRCQFTV